MVDITPQDIHNQNGYINNPIKCGIVKIIYPNAPNNTFNNDSFNLFFIEQ